MFDLTPWRSMRELDNLHREMDIMWRQFLGESSGLGFAGETWIPSIDLSETKDEVIVRLDVPGMKAKDIDVALNGNMLTVKGERKQEKREDECFHLLERDYGAFSRNIQLPCDVDNGKIDASYKNGTLEIRLPKTEESKERHIEIKVQ